MTGAELVHLRRKILAALNEAMNLAAHDEAEKTHGTEDRVYYRAAGRCDGLEQARELVLGILDEHYEAGHS